MSRWAAHLTTERAPHGAPALDEPLGGAAGCWVAPAALRESTVPAERESTASAERESTASAERADRTNVVRAPYTVAAMRPAIGPSAFARPIASARCSSTPGSRRIPGTVRARKSSTTAVWRTFSSIWYGT